MLEKRRYARTSIDLPVSFAIQGGGEGNGTGKDISLGGIFIETEASAAFGAAIVVHVRLDTPNGAKDFALPGVVRWSRVGGMGVQFGLLGALETHAILELSQS